MFIFIHHESNTVQSTYDLTLKMKITMGFSENVVEEKPIYIHFYAIENENEPIYHQVEQGVDSNLKKITFEGSLMGYY